MAKEDEAVIAHRIKRMRWWKEARFGMFIHWGLYSQLGRGEWVKNRERIPDAEYERLADTWTPQRCPARAWARLAKKAGMKYMVLTAKHHEGFCLWDSQRTDFCAAQRGPRRDLVREFVEACRAEGLKVGLYYSLMDWHHPDGHACAHDEDARRRFVDYTHDLVRELMTQYGRIDILWYDVSWPLPTAAAWESARLNAMVRAAQPHIIINDRSILPEDYTTPEEHITAGSDVGGRGWEACMTFNGSWGWQDTPPEDWHSARKVLEMLRTCTAWNGNLLLNIGPLPDGTVPELAVERLRTVGRWLERYGEAVYGKVDPITGLEFSNNIQFTRKGRTVYGWMPRWPGRELAIGGVRGAVRRVTLLPDGRALTFRQEKDRLLLTGLPAKCPDRIAGVGMIKLEFATFPSQQLGSGCEYLKPLPPSVVSEAVDRWRVSGICPRPEGGIAEVSYARPGKDWTLLEMNHGNFLNVHPLAGNRDGVIHFTKRFRVDAPGPWTLAVGHDGGVRMFVDGAPVLAAVELKNPAVPLRSKAAVELTAGEHEVSVAFDLCGGKGWGIFFNWEKTGTRKKETVTFPAETE